MGKSRHLTSDIIEVCDVEKSSGYLKTIDFEKAFDSTNHAFLILALKKYGFGDSYIDLMKICVINEGHTTTYFKLERRVCQGDPISAYSFITALEIFFILIKTNENKHGLKIYDHEYLYTAYVDDTKFGLKDISLLKLL